MNDDVGVDKNLIRIKEFRALYNVEKKLVLLN